MRRSITLNAYDRIWRQAPWPTAIEMSKVLPPASWTLVGGLMVQLHAKTAGLDHPRPTTDVDSILHMETESISFPRAAKALRDAGFELDGDTTFAYRFRRGNEQIDVMCSDIHKEHRGKKFEGRELFGISGGRRAMKDTWNIHIGERGSSLIVPSVQGALVLKGAAWMEDSRNAMRHLEDSVMLFACSDEPGSILLSLSPTSRQRIRHLVSGLRAHPEAWLTHSPEVQSLAEEALEAF